MVEENNGENVAGSESSRTSEADRVFSRLSQVVPKRRVEIEEEDIEVAGNGYGTLEERMAGSRKMTDLQVADMRLNPDLGNKGKTEYLNVLRMERTFPEVYNPLFRIMVKEVVRNTGMSVAEAIAYVNTALSISFDGEGRIDVIAIAKGIGEAKTEEEKKKLGLP